MHFDSLLRYVEKKTCRSILFFYVGIMRSLLPLIGDAISLLASIKFTNNWITRLDDLYLL